MSLMISRGMAAAMMLVAIAADADVYKKVFPDGHVEYAAQPQEGFERIIKGPATAGLAAHPASCSPRNGHWREKRHWDALSDATITTRTISSRSAVQLGWPYPAQQHATLMIRTHPRHGEDVLLSIRSGQFVCGSGCTLSVRYDDGPVEAIRAASPADHAANMLFLNPVTAVSNALSCARRVRIEATFFQSGSQTLDFSL